MSGCRHTTLSDITATKSTQASLGYEALSYTWGDQSHRQAIYMQNGERVLFIGENCYRALKNLRQAHRD
ncbi:hypothetical protein BU23DRAFT_45366 [Bimuria novae-zelandiae CBS 107.79]|uniref:Heterokaryon incompatibility domain-containing protein n=1 Tax=Bimuria novae-zelandiae CBS 107.79 TaxID=1447943 RepID=A0A6A5VI21_9PLEO|nr:hypothetical protein BU23DRAFT_45366 [Bimuria novae-zelandiae CBS 107.79]